MSNWNQLRDYIIAKYKVADEETGMIKLIFDVGTQRSQVVFIWHRALMEGAEEWVQIESPIGELEEVSFVPLMREVATTMCGGIGAVGDLVTYRHSLPLENLDINEFERPLALVTTTADRLEKKLVGGDRF